MKNPIHVLQDRHPRIWCVTIFVPMVVITIVAVPMVFLFEFIADTPRICSNLWDDVRGFWYTNKIFCKQVVGDAWKSWANAAALAKCKQKVSKQCEEKGKIKLWNMFLKNLLSRKSR